MGTVDEIEKMTPFRKTKLRFLAYGALGVLAKNRQDRESSGAADLVTLD
jgi:hypothetical protein